MLKLMTMGGFFATPPPTPAPIPPPAPPARSVVNLNRVVVEHRWRMLADRLVDREWIREIDADLLEIGR